MRAATIRDGKIVVAEHPDPAEPGAGQVLVRVHAAGLTGRRGADQAADAYAHFAGGGKIGKIVLTFQ